MLCREWNWVQENGSLRDMIARGFMLELHRSGHITLPARKQNPSNSFLNRKKPERPTIDQTPVKTCLKTLSSLEIVLVKNTPHEPLFNGLIEHYHYLGYCHPVGEQLKYMALTGNRPVACFSWSSAPRHIGARDRYIGWKKEHRDHNLRYIAYNSRFLILPWFQVPHLASFLLWHMARTLSRDWEGVYRHPVYYLETFVDTELFADTCYKAANWQYLGDFHCKQIKLSSQQKKRLSQKAISLDKHAMEDVAGIFKPETILGWHRNLVGQKYDSSKSSPENRRGPKPVPQEYVDAILKFAKRNPSWGYKRIASTMEYLGMKVSASTVKRVLDDYGIVPDPEQKKRIDWERFISSHIDSLAATDFFTVEVMTPTALLRYMVLFFIDIKTRKVELAGIAHDPDGKWVAQMARNQTDAFDGFLLGKKYLIHDRDPLYTKQFDVIMEGSGVKIKRLPAFMPVTNSFAESFVKSIKTECINKMIVTSEKQLRYIVKEYIEHYNHERPHRGLGGKMIEPYPQDENGEIVEFNRLGGLRSYRRVSQLPAAA